jgi:hypothetical protein
MDWNKFKGKLRHWRVGLAMAAGVAAPVAVVSTLVLPQQAAQAAAVVQIVPEFLRMARQLLTLAPQVGLQRCIDIYYSAIALLRSLGDREPGDRDLFGIMINMLFPDGPNNRLQSADYDGRANGGYPIPGIPSKAIRNLPFVWQKVELPPEVATCADGSTYKFFVNFTPVSNNIQISMDSGGVCYDYESCEGNRAARKPDGTVEEPVHYLGKGSVLTGAQGPVTDSYMQAIDWGSFASSKFNLVGFGYITQPLTSRIGTIAEAKPFRTKQWNLIHLPYCTGDIYIGNKKNAVLTGPGGMVTARNFQGMNVMAAALGWIRNNLPRPAQLYATGQSAGAIALDILRPFVSQVVQPDRALYLLDGAMVTRSNLYEGGDKGHEQEWKSSKTVAKAIGVLTDFDPKDPSKNPGKKNVITTVANLVPGSTLLTDGSVHDQQVRSWRVRPQDRVLYTGTYEDKLNSNFMFSQYPGLVAEGYMLEGDPNLKMGRPAAMHSPYGMWLLENWSGEQRALQDRVEKSGQRQVGFFHINGRQLNEAHCLTLITYDNTRNTSTGSDVYYAMGNLRAGWKQNIPVTRMDDYKALSRGSLYDPLSPTTKLVKMLVGSELFLNIDP